MNNYLIHYGIKGQKWGVRHWQNADGTFNEAGKIRYFGSTSSRGDRLKFRADKASSIAKMNRSNKKTDTTKKVLKATAVVAGTALAIYGAYKLNGLMKSDRGRALLAKGRDLYLSKKSSYEATKMKNALDYIHSTGSRGFQFASPHYTRKRKFSPKVLTDKYTRDLYKLDKAYAYAVNRGVTGVKWRS